MHYTEVDNLIPVILAAQDGDAEAMSQLLDRFSYDSDREAAYGKSFNVAEHLSQPSTQSSSQLTRT